MDNPEKLLARQAMQNEEKQTKRHDTICVGRNVTYFNVSIICRV